MVSRLDATAGYDETLSGPGTDAGLPLVLVHQRTWRAGAWRLRTRRADWLLRAVAATSVSAAGESAPSLARIWLQGLRPKV